MTPENSYNQYQCYKTVLTLFILMDFPIHIDTTNMDLFIL